MTGFFLIIIGAIFLFKNLGFISAGVWDILWPILLIIIGISFVVRRGEFGFFFKEHSGWRKRKVDKEK